jgi:cyclic pyranopterin phosphate synthase
MPTDATFMPEQKYLSFDEMAEVISELCDYGLEEVRLTGGEPLMRAGFSTLTHKLSALPLKKIGLTTNGVFLGRHLSELKRDRVHHINVSLDSLNAEIFQKVTNGNQLTTVLRNIESAKEMGFEIKINVVSMRGVNDHELFDFVEYAREMAIELRFLEIMRIGYACKDQTNRFIPSQELMQRLKSRFLLSPVAKQSDSTSFNFRLDNGAQIGFIASESQAFCGQCSRWRLSADGIMRACLLKDDGLSIKGKTPAQREEIFHALLGMKPAMRPAEVTHYMNTIGG